MTTGQTSRARVALDVLLYALARLLLLIALTAVIYGVAWLLGVREFPLIVAALLALIVALPLGMWVFAPLRRRATGGLAAANEQRRRDREQLRARLRGEVSSSEPD
ncbi:MAG TPA: DUF4229 domain-containing protein [Mycobacterium sp.]|nr:DUF4229 domain-containing protein [Mycobacterium sp.]